MNIGTAVSGSGGGVWGVCGRCVGGGCVVCVGGCEGSGGRVCGVCGGSRGGVCRTCGGICSSRLPPLTFVSLSTTEEAFPSATLSEAS